jgi:hypothetical protein
MFVLSKNNNSKDKCITHLATKMIVPNTTINTNLEDIEVLSKIMNIDKFYVFTIIICDTFEYELEQFKEHTHIKHIKVGSTYFINNFLNNKDKTVDF